MNRAQTLHEIVVEKYRKGQISIRLNRSCLLSNYSQVSNNPLVKIFHFFVWLYSFPLTIVAVSAFFLYSRQFVCLAYYGAGLIALLAIERYISQRVTIGRALSNRQIFSYLVKKGVITIRDAAEPDSPI